ncbi:SusC/RagA family TonB-linked outer membrane protein [Sphingobacterium sp. LRF_L2]|uniref:SusC/RagA family TonB-linked outer membrane protein n=1 Tax=Sphingobacterium sp. LRF_L2 TaxID=3369421 RepID=UPI003F5DBA90
MKPKLLVLFVCLLVSVGGYAQKRVSLAQALGEVTRLYGTKFSYEDGLLRNAQVNADQVPKNKNTPVESVLKELLYPNSFLFLYVQNNYYTIIRDSRGSKDNEGDERFWKVISGYVKDSEGKPLVGVTVLPVGYATRSGVTTSSDGHYTLRLAEPAEALVFSYVGMEPQRQPIGNSNQINVSMGSLVNQLEEVEIVSTGYQKISKERATGAFGTISEKQLKETPTINIMERIEGVVPGVQVDVRNNTIRVRGISSFGNSTDKEPLIVIDGFPMTDNVDSKTRLTTRGVGSAANNAVLSTINPEDIQNITVLKDAAAASIWGAQAANGVIVIETKRGRNSVPTINFSTNLSISAPADLKDLNRMSSAEYIELEKELKERGYYTDNYVKDSWMNFNQKAPFSEAVEWMFKVDRGTATEAERDAALDKLASIDNTDQIRDYLLQNATSQQYNLSISGGTNKNSYYVSGNYSKDVPVYRGAKGESFSMTSNLTNQFFNDRVKLTTGMNYNYGKSLSNQAAANAIGGTTLGLRPYELLKDETGNVISRNIRYRDEVAQSFVDQGYLDWSYSPINEIDATNYVAQSHRLRFHTDINTKINSWINLSLSGQLYRNIEDSENVDKLSSYSMRNMINYGTTVSSTGKLIYGVPLGGSLQSQFNSGWQYVLRSQLNLDKNFGQSKEHNFTAIVGTEMKQNTYRIIGQRFYGFNEDTYGFATVNPTVSYTTVDTYSSTIGGSNSSQKGINRALSYYANGAGAFFGNKYVLSASVRFDDATLLGATRSQRAQPLWSIGGKWDVKQESFLNDLSWVNGLAIRLTHGVNGTIPSNPGAFTVITTSMDNVTNETTASISTPGNNAVGWEKVRSTNLGVDFSTWNSRLSFSADYYTKRTTDILYSLPFNPTYGWTQLTVNGASMDAHGIDLGINGNWWRTENFNWSTTVNFSYNTNEVTDSRFEASTYLSSWLGGGTPTVGKPVGYLYAYRWAGLDENGQSQIYNKDGEIITSAQYNNTITTDDLVYMGRTTAPYFGGLFNNFAYKNFTLGVRLSYEMGHVLRRISIENYPTWNTTSLSGLIGTQKDLTLRWRESGDEMKTNVPGLVSDGNMSNSIDRYKNADLLVISGSHVRLQQINFGYTFPANFLKRTPFKSLSANASVRNLGILWRKNKDGIDPQYLSTSNYGNMSPVKQFFFSINTSF